MSRLFQLAICGLFLVLCPIASGAAYTSLYAFGDGVCTTTSNIVAYPLSTNYYGRRSSNGRVWIEVLAERQGLTYDPNKNWSFFGHYSPNLVTNVTRFVAPPDVNTALFIVWVANADFVYAITQYAPYTSDNLGVWTNALNRSLSNHFTAISILHAKGVRTLVMPNAVDLTRVPFYVGLADASKSFIRQRVLDFNTAFADRLEQARAAFPGLTIVSPDIYTLLENFLAHPGDYGLTNALFGGQSIDAVTDPTLKDKSLNGPGANYVFWDYLNPSARAHAVVADVTHQVLSPTHISGLWPAGNSNRLELANLPLGLAGFVEGSTNFLDWATVQSIPGTNAPQTMLLPAGDPAEFYRLRFPFAWTWP